MVTWQFQEFEQSGFNFGKGIPFFLEIEVDMNVKYFLKKHKKSIFCVVLIVSVGVGVTVYRLYAHHGSIETLEINPVQSVFEAQAGNFEQERRIVVHIGGGVVSPGVYSLKKGDRVLDLLNSAGGALPQASLDKINLAQPLRDGQRITVPVNSVSQPKNSGPDFKKGEPKKEMGKVDINLATEEEWAALSGIGPGLARLIVEEREKRGDFKTIEDLLRVRGIGDMKLKKIRQWVVL